MPNVQTIGNQAFYECNSLSSAYFYVDAPTSFGSGVFENCASAFTIYYAKGTSGWTTPTWNGYPTQEFTPTGYYYVTFIDGLTGEQIAQRAVKYGSDAIAPEHPVHEGYTFTGWDKSYTNVTSDLTVTAQYEAAEAYMNLQYEVKNNEVIIIGYTSEPQGDLLIPEQLLGHMVTAIEDSAFYGCENITSIEMPSVKKIGEYAFCGCSGLKSVSMPSVENIGASAFDTCMLLSNVEIPKVQTIAERSFYNCINLESIILQNANAIGEAAFDSCTALVSIKIQKVKSIGGKAFMHCTALKSVELPNAVRIGESAFNGCTGLERIEMPNVKEIAAEAFRYCNSLESVNLPNLEKLGEYAFAACGCLRKAELTNVKTVDDRAFENCYSLEKIDILNVQTVGRGAFYNCTGIKTVVMAQVQSIHDKAFNSCLSMESAYFYADAPAKFGEEVFDGCADTFTIYCAKDTQGWTTPMWNGYPIKIFDPTSGEIIDGEFFTGDVNGDSKVNTADAVYLLKNAAGMLTLTSEQMQVADLNHDGKINTADAVMILRYVAGIITLD